jgi:pimeloyl-ACP methyl ester carboxylesterase
MRTLLRFCSLLPLLATGLVCSAQPEQPLGTGLEGLDYPYPVRYLDLTMEGEPARLAYMDVVPAEAANGRTVVLMHGRNFFGLYWEQTIRFLTGHGYRVIVPDQIGFGKSSKPDVPHSLHAHAANTKKLLDTLGVDRAILVGHSLGGMMAIRFALMYPHRVERLVLEDPIGLEDYRIPVPYASREELTAEALKTPREAVDQLFHNFVATWRPEFQVYADAQYRWMLGPEAYRIARTAAHTYTMAYEQPVMYELHLLKPTTLLIAGERDRAAIGRNRVNAQVRASMGLWPQIARRAADAIPDCRLVLLAEVAHIPHLEVPDVFHAELRRFLER